MILRIFVEKKPGFRSEAEELLEQFGGDGRLTSVRVLNRYDVENLSPENRGAAIRYVFSEPMTDDVYTGSFPVSSDEFCFAVEYLPGQYNQRADSAAQCLQLVAKQSDCTVETAAVYVLRGDIDGAFVDGVKAQLINPVDSREASMSKPDTLKPVLPEPGPVAVVAGFTAWDGARLGEFHAESAFAMSLDDLRLIQAHFKSENRDPTVTELRVLDTYWSDHCRHTTFLTALEDIEIEPGVYTEPIRAAYKMYTGARRELGSGLDVCLMDMATAGMRQLKAAGKLDDLDDSPEINACSIRVDADIDGQPQPWLVQFKNETHNHPTEIEPFGGAATCLGGAIRDPLAGRAFVYQAMRVTGAGDPRAPLSETLPGKLPQKRLTREAARGFSSYGNQIGLATGLVREIYHPGFVAKRMEIGAVAGAVPECNVRREVPAPGDRVLLIGGRTGRDGCGGATGSSKAHTEQSLNTCGAEVQKGNPVTERKLQRLFRNPEAARMIKRCNDFGAGGVSVAVGELADGLDIDLDRVPKKYEGIDGTELAISESQERMAVVVDAGDVEKFIGLCLNENVEASEVARVTEQPRMRMRWRGEVIADLPRALMDTNGAKQAARAVVTNPSGDTPFSGGGGSGDLKSRWLALMGELNVCGQIGLSEQFDSSIGAGTVLMPFGGKHQLTPAEASVCKLPLTGGETDTATILAHGYDPVIAEWSPFHGAVYAVAEALAKITACGGDHTRTRFSFQEYFEKLGSDPVKWGKPAAGMLGAYWAQIKTGCAALGGKDSMSGTFRDLNVPPVVAAFGLCVCDARHVVSPEFKKPGSHAVLAPSSYDESHLPDMDALAANYSRIHALVKEGKILAAHTVGRFGAAEALAKMCFGNNLGLRIDGDIDLFEPGCGAIILEMPDVSGIPGGWRVIGQVSEQPRIAAGGSQIEVPELLGAWMATLEPVFPSKPRAEVPVSDHTSETSDGKFTAPPVIKTKPRVFLPIFPGINCEYDSVRAFERAGASVETLIFRNLAPPDVEASIEAMRAAAGRAHMVMLAGGFSAGDEPDGSAKFIAAVFRNPSVKDSLHAFLERGGLMLGICNGFQALIKLGLLTHGRITEPSADAPTLARNTIGRHISHIAATRIVSNGSPWLAGVKPGDLHNVPISHGEGRFAAPDETVRELFSKGRVAAVYHGKNLNGSAGGIEGIISPCGRILGKMGHSERFSRNTYKNIPGNFDQRIFESGVSYFTGK